GNRTGYRYDGRGNVTRSVDAKNTDANCNLRDGGVAWTYTYTARNDLETATAPPTIGLDGATIVRQSINGYDPTNGALRTVARPHQAGADDDVRLRPRGQAIRGQGLQRPADALRLRSERQRAGDHPRLRHPKPGADDLSLHADQPGAVAHRGGLPRYDL